MQKHGSRPTSAFPNPTGNIAQVNAQGQYEVDNILTFPGNVVEFDIHPTFGPIIDIHIPNGGGVRFLENGKMVGFLEPNIK